MPARGRRSAKPFTRRRSAAAFRLRPPVPRMNLSPNRGREDGAAVRPGPPGVVRLRPLLAGRQVLPGYGYGCPFGAQWHIRRFAARSGAFADALFSAAFCRRPFSAARPGATVCRHLFADVLFSAARPFGAAPLFFVPDGTVRSAPSRLCPLSSLPPLRSVPSPLCPLSAPSRSRPVPVPVPSFGGAPLRRFFFGPRVEKPEKLFRFVISK